jgi:hypothetical protein
MPLDPVVVALFERLPQLLTYKVWEKTPEEVREAYRSLCDHSDLKDIPIGKVEKLQAPGPTGPLAVRSYTPIAPGQAPLPAIVYFHGGGFVMGDLDTQTRMMESAARSRTKAAAVFSRSNTGARPSTRSPPRSKMRSRPRNGSRRTRPSSRSIRTASRSPATLRVAISPRWFACSRRRTRPSRISRSRCCCTPRSV